MQNKATTVKEYLAGLPDDRRASIEAVRAVILKNLGKGYTEAMSYGMIGYAVPHSVYPQGYHCDPKLPLPFAGLASQKGHMSLHLMFSYLNSEVDTWFRTEWAKTGKKLDMGQACVRFKKLDDLALDVIGELIRRMPVDAYIAHYESIVRNPAAVRAAKPAKPAKPGTAKAVKAGSAVKTQNKAAGVKKTLVKPVVRPVVKTKPTTASAR